MKLSREEARWQAADTWPAFFGPVQSEGSLPTLLEFVCRKDSLWFLWSLGTVVSRTAHGARQPGLNCRLQQQLPWASVLHHNRVMQKHSVCWPDRHEHRLSGRLPLADLGIRAHIGMGGEEHLAQLRVFLPQILWIKAVTASGVLYPFTGALLSWFLTAWTDLVLNGPAANIAWSTTTFLTHQSSPPFLNHLNTSN